MHARVGLLPAFILCLISPGIATPALYLVDLERRSIYMEYVDNATVLKDFIDKSVSGEADLDHLLDFIGRGLGTLIARLHSRHIIHGDLTTSNILLRNDPSESTRSGKTEGNKSLGSNNNNNDINNALRLLSMLDMANAIIVSLLRSMNIAKEC